MQNLVKIEGTRLCEDQSGTRSPVHACEILSGFRFVLHNTRMMYTHIYFVSVLRPDPLWKTVYVSKRETLKGRDMWKSAAVTQVSQARVLNIARVGHF